MSQPSRLDKGRTELDAPYIVLALVIEGVIGLNINIEWRFGMENRAKPQADGERKLVVVFKVDGSVKIRPTYVAPTSVMNPDRLKSKFAYIVAIRFAGKRPFLIGEDS